MTTVESSVNFPVVEPPGAGSLDQLVRGPHLPFRRISLPTAPTLQHRQSVVSVASFDSVPGNGESISPQRPARPRRVRPPSMESPMRPQRRRDGSARPVEDAARAAKARKIIDEFYETEKAYTRGLEMIYSHFLEPIIHSLDTVEPLLDRSTINSIFSNFIDIWNFHRSFLSALEVLLEMSKNGPLQLSPLLLSHFPYLSLYNPFVTSFPSTITALSELSTPPTPMRQNANYNSIFSDFLSKQEADPRCRKLKLRDWLLTIVQRCPRYLLLLKDLITTTSHDDPEHAQLTTAHGLVSKITTGLNTSLHSHAQTLALLALQRATANLPFQLISPGRNLVRRGSLLQTERNVPPRPREFLLFSDCLIWLASVDTGSNWESLNGWNSGGSSSGSHAPSTSAPARPTPLLRNRSRSEAELPHASRSTSVDRVSPASPNNYAHRRSYHPNLPLPPPLMAQSRGTSSSSDERWVYKGKVDLVDIDITVGSILGDGYGFEILNPEESFVVYAGSEQSRNEWVASLRSAKAQLLESLNATNPNSTLTSSASTNHIRRSLQALPFHPSDDRLAAFKGHDMPASPSKKAPKREKVVERRGKVEHWVPPVWIPDGKTSECMRCSRLFGWRRRRHHCRLCGRCVCNACSGRTFFIADPSKEDGGTKSARACDVCYESVFPIIDSSLPTEPSRIDDTITSLSKLPSWFSMPSMPSEPAQPHALMAIDSKFGPDASLGIESPPSIEEKEPPGVVRLRPHQKLKSYHEILEDFEAHERGGLKEVQRSGTSANQQCADRTELEDEENREEYLRSCLFLTPPHSLAPSPQSSPVRRQEDTARRRKRFSFPAVALQTTQVTARASLVIEDHPVDGGNQSTTTTPARQQRFSVVLSPSKLGYENNRRSSVVGALEEFEGGEDVLGRGLAANRLSQLLCRQPRDQ